ncbi:MAG TPA: hypothetical protein VMT45_00875 [Thermoanaerobaculaceae bacterium]|nr:hypothetical protein [Thermoanaerobaculaceae bacterium]
MGTKLLALCCSAAAAWAAAATPARPLVGFTVHWDFFSSAVEAERLVSFALDNGAEVLNVVPPPRIWEDPESLAILRRIFVLARERGAGVVLNRIDGSSLPSPSGARSNWLYAHVLTERGRLPSGRPTPEFFLATVGKEAYERWLREETAYYADAFSGEPNLLAFGVGLFNEPFVSQRGSLLCFDGGTESYEVGQYTPDCAVYWHRYLSERFGAISAVNARYRANFSALAAVPMPKSERDPAFGDPTAAYFDFVSAINAWVVARLEECRSLWRARARRPVPFMLQFSGFVPEKFEKGRPAFVALDIFDWMQRADALGLSAYTNCGYRDWGHASASAMVNFLRLASLIGKPVFVLECGTECDGAVLDPSELDFVVTVARPLGPASVIYEFLKTSYAERFATSAGKLLGADFRPRAAAVTAIRAALRSAQQPAAAPAVVYVLDDLVGLPGDAALLAARGRLARLAMQRPLTFVPEQALEFLPRGTTLVVPSASRLAVLRERLAPRGVAVQGAELLGREERPPSGPAR